MPKKMPKKEGSSSELAVIVYDLYYSKAQVMLGR